MKSNEPMNTSFKPSTALFPVQILPIPFDDLGRMADDCLLSLGPELSEKERKDRQKEIQDFLFNLESMVFLDGERRADSLMTHLLRWSGPGFTRRFYQTRADLTPETYTFDQRFVTGQLDELLRIAHYRKLPPEWVEKSMRDLSYEKIYVRLQNVDFLNFYVRGFYTVQQRETLTRTVAKRVPVNGKWTSSFLPPDQVRVFEEVVVVASETHIPEDGEEDSPEGSDSVSSPPINQEPAAEPSMRNREEIKNADDRTGIKRRKAIQQLVKEKMRCLQGKSLDEIMAEHTPDPNTIQHLHLLVYHNIPETDLELLLPNAEISLGVKEYLQLCFTGTATLPSLGRVFLNRSLRKLLFFFNPLFYGIYRVLYKINIVRTEQKYQHAHYLLNHRLARGGKAVSHLIDDYENVLKREALLIVMLLAKESNGLTRNELENRTKDFIQQHWHIELEPDLARVLRVLCRWGIVKKNKDRESVFYSLPPLKELLVQTALTRENLQGKIWTE